MNRLRLTVSPLGSPSSDVGGIGRLSRGVGEEPIYLLGRAPHEHLKKLALPAFSIEMPEVALRITLFGRVGGPGPILRRGRNLFAG